MTVPGAQRRFSSEKATPDHLGNTVSRWRREKGYTQHYLAHAIGISAVALSRIETGVNRPTAELWVRLIHALDMSPSPAAWEVFVLGETRCGRIIALADELLDQGLIVDARWVVSEAEQLNQTSFHGRYNGELDRLWGCVAFLEGNYLEASRRFEQMTRNATKGLRRRQAIAAYDHSIALFHLSRWASGLAQLSTAQRLFAQDGDSRGEGLAHWARGTALLRMGEYESAQTNYEQAAKSLMGTPEAAFPKFGALICESALGLAHGTTIQKLMTLVEEAPASMRPRIYHFIGTVTRLNGDPRHALEWLDRSLLTEPIGSEQWCDTQCERLLCLCLTGATAEAADLWPDVAEHWGSLNEHNTLALAIMGIMLKQSPPPDTGRPWIRRHHERRVDAVIDWAWRYGVSGPQNP
ncbi:MAG: helix-turn-helix domain-containing protein [Clostridia bacterium]